MSYVYSSEKNLFFTTELKTQYEKLGDWPTDAVDVTHEIFTEFTSYCKGKVRVVGDDGMPAWADTPAPTYEQLVDQAEYTQQALISAAVASISVIQLKLQAGRKLTDAETEKLNIILDYIDAVTATDTSTAPDIEWPPLPY